MDLERQLRDSLAARDPDGEFEARVLARLAHQQSGPPHRIRSWRVPAALAASVFAAAIGLNWYFVQQRDARAHQQLLLAMQITSLELTQVQQKLTRNGPQEN
jgi:hypothetical protein